MVLAGLAVGCGAPDLAGSKSALAIVLHCLSCGLPWHALAQTDILSYVRKQPRATRVTRKK